MRHYDRAGFRHLNDGERYRDYDYMADDGWIGPNERAPYGYAHDDAPPWSTHGEWQTRPFAGEGVIDRERGQGREYGRDRGLGYGRSYDPTLDVERSARDDYARGFPHPLRVDDGRVRPGDLGMVSSERPAGFAARPAGGRAPAEERPGRSPGARLLGAVRNPRQTMLRAVRGLFRGRTITRSPDERRIQLEVLERLARHPEIDAREIAVAVTKGDVTLRGTVANRRMKLLAEEAADRVPGVNEIHNRLTIAAARRA